MSEPVTQNGSADWEEAVRRINLGASPHGTVAATAAAVEEEDISDLRPRTGNYPAETALYQTVVLTDIPGESTDLLAITGPVDLTDPVLGLYSRPGEGVIVATQQRWMSRGVTLGRLLHSLALAPGESTRIAVVDWDRSDAGRSADTARQDELNRASTTDRRDTRDAAESTAAQQDQGSSSTNAGSTSVSAGMSTGFAGMFGGFGASMSASTNRSFANTVARSSSAKEAAASAVQQIAAETQQAASAVRARQATVIKETKQSEAAQVSTRVVTNYNHMHAMSVQYYEVIQVYEVTTTPVRIDRCVFVPLAELTFTPALVRRFSRVLAAAAPRDWAEKITASATSPTSVSKTRLSGAWRAGAPGEAAPDGFTVSTPPNSPALQHIAAGPTGTVCGVTPQGNGVRWDPVNETWAALPPLPDGSPMAMVAVGPADTIWATGQNKAVYQLTGGAFVQDMRAYLNMVACAADGTVWGVGSSNNATYRMDPDGWHDFGGAWAGYLAAANRKRIWHVGRDSRVQPGTPDGNGWRGVYDDNPGPIKMIVAAPDATLWAITTDNDLYVRDSDSTPFRRPTFASHPELAKLQCVAPVAADDVWGIRPDGFPVHITKLDAFTEFGDEDGAADPSTLEVWWDEELVRGIRLILAGTSGRSITAGDTMAGLHRTSFTFDRNDPPVSITIDPTSAEGGGIRRITVTTGSGQTVLGPDPDGRTIPGVALPLGGASICGLFGEVGRTAQGQFVATAGFSVRGEAVDGAVLRHLNDNADRYNQAVWANADELMLSRLLASYAYVPTEPPGTDGQAPPPSPHPGPLGANVDPRPVAITGNYLAFRWTYPTEAQRKSWLERSGVSEGDAAASQPTVVAIPSGGVFAEAVLGRANSAERLDLSRFWNWKDSPIPILPPEISPVSTASRARDLDLTSPGLDPAMAQLQQLRALPDPGGLRAITKTMTTKIFDDMSKASENAELAGKSLSAAAAGDQAAGQRALSAYQAALAHQEATMRMAIDAAKEVLPLVAPELAAGSSIASAAGLPGGAGAASRGVSGVLPSGGGLLGDGLAALTGGGASGGGVTNLPAVLANSGNPTVAGAVANYERARSAVAGPGGPSAIDSIVEQLGMPALKQALTDQPVLRGLAPDRVVDLMSSSLLTNLLDDKTSAGDVVVRLSSGPVTVPAAEVPNLRAGFVHGFTSRLPVIIELLKARPS